MKVLNTEIFTLTMAFQKLTEDDVFDFLAFGGSSYVGGYARYKEFKKCVKQCISGIFAGNHQVCSTTRGTVTVNDHFGVSTLLHISEGRSGAGNTCTLFYTQNPNPRATGILPISFIIHAVGYHTSPNSYRIEDKTEQFPTGYLCTNELVLK
jgi:hypothetical protein